ncbi:MAG TPA: tRNA 2-thiouridine(34) synthase MnmA, partial [Candidatus Brocadiia bacterium]|nr:tRNA 2-thiouridine(34) synthase MnmA [Candidatus Brocadiia bacterium]
RALFPLGGMTKAQVRQLARELRLPVAQKPGSQDICFLAGGDYRALLAQRRPQALEPGPIIDTQGRVLGQHQGTATVTIGQRRGLKIAGGQPLFVVAIHPERREVVLGPIEDLMTDHILVGAPNWTGMDEPTQPLDAHVKVRYRQREQPATLIPLSPSRLEVRFHTPQKAPAPGQSAVFYRDDVVLGGGLILPPNDSA